MAMRWSEEVTLTFVKLYLKSECLWKPTDREYKNKRERQHAYDYMSAQFDEATGVSLTTDEVKTKIKNLRSTYSQELAKIMKAARAGRVYEPTIIWFQEMDQHLKHLRSRSNAWLTIGKDVADEDVTQQMIASSDEKVWVQQDAEEESGDPDPLVPASEDDYEPSYKPECGSRRIKVERRSLCSPSNFKKKFKNRRGTSTSIYNGHSDAIQTSQILAAPTEDEFDIYGKYIASHLRKMDLLKALRLQVEINNLVTGARLAEFGAHRDTDVQGIMG